MLPSHLSLAPKPSLVGHVFGGLLALGAAVSIGIGATSGAFGPIAPLGNLFRWEGLGLFLLTVVPSALYAIRPGLLGGPVSWYLALGYRYPEGHLYRAHPRLIAQLLIWMGLGMSGLFWLFGSVPLLRRDSPYEKVVLAGCLLLMYGPPLIVAGQLGRRLRQRRQ